MPLKGGDSMPELTKIAGSDLVKNSRNVINENFETVACDFAGTAFPVKEVKIGTVCYRTDKKQVYRYTADNVWTLEVDLSAGGALIAGASFAEKAKLDNKGQQIDSTYIKDISPSGAQLVITKGDGTKVNITHQDLNDKVTIAAVPTSTSKEYAIVLNKNGTSTGTDTTVIDNNITVNPYDHSVTAANFKGKLTGDITGKAPYDGVGNDINATYIKGIAIDGTTLTATKGNGSTVTATIDTNYNTTKSVTATKHTSKKLNVSYNSGTIDSTSGSGNITDYYEQISGAFSAGTYSLATILQSLINKCHEHKLNRVYSNCNCNCDCDCGDDCGGA